MVHIVSILGTKLKRGQTAAASKKLSLVSDFLTGIILILNY